jgi:hypothetical protein
VVKPCLANRPFGTAVNGAKEDRWRPGREQLKAGTAAREGALPEPGQAHPLRLYRLCTHAVAAVAKEYDITGDCRGPAQPRKALLPRSCPVMVPKRGGNLNDIALDIIYRRREDQIDGSDPHLLGYQRRRPASSAHCQEQRRAGPERPFQVASIDRKMPSQPPLRRIRRVMGQAADARDLGRASEEQQILVGAQVE